MLSKTVKYNAMCSRPLPPDPTHILLLLLFTAKPGNQWHLKTLHIEQQQNVCFQIMSSVSVHTPSHNVYIYIYTSIYNYYMIWHTYHYIVMNSCTNHYQNTIKHSQQLLNYHLVLITSIHKVTSTAEIKNKKQTLR